ncbi:MULTISPECIES: nucleotidyltransferase domain-containing protein [Streptomyces]|uniref:nucleotidyltransferase domain-containing protein n=1 Tax=Streptomyces TaxID=1883 RepID=UPI00345C2541
MARQLTEVQRLALISKWKSPPGPAEQDRLERAERMVREAVSQHEPFRDLSITVAAKGSYPNNTNVRGDSDVDIKVQLNDPFYYDGPWSGANKYTGPWTEDKLRQEVRAALTRRFGTVDANHNLAFYVPEVAGSRPSIDVVPCFKYTLSDSAAPEGRYVGSIVFGRDGKQVINWPELQLLNGRAKNTRTNLRYKFVVRVLKSVENDLADEGVITPLPSYFSECLVYNVPDHVLLTGSLDDAVRSSLQEVYRQLTSPWPGTSRMVEPNEVKKLFGPGQKWDEKDARELVEGAWSYLNYGG